ncbi:TPA: hypothetical protein KDX74_004588 [Vibrio parahaemolyticus]|nr:hypothetical protein [Vibrio parahaemolyticus]EHU5162159.1 hypothetical protein [Vibrio parahaemolyticus]EJG0650188.1 hypothetical protein [Vibrio parahaemolyticus]ELA9417238.1 hypothetical protein [Vibrio parahaemolyticus]MCI9706859.1 hypothetical protein [Vibrio parahaemolyticus]
MLFSLHENLWQKIMKTIKIKLSYQGGDADLHRLDMYDASMSLHGFARAIAITTHALLNDGDVKRKGNRANGAKIYVSPPQKGSYEQILTLVIENKEAIGVSVVAAAFWDMLKWTWSKTLDLAYEPETSTVKKLGERVEPFIGDIEEVLESALEEAHRPIKNSPNMSISVSRPKVGEVVRMNSETLKSVSIKTDDTLITGIVGNATKYNILSGIGRFYDDEKEHTVSFKIPENASSSVRRRITWSMHYAQDGQHGGKIELHARRVMSAKGILKRYLVDKVILHDK